jgi:hypothetical protein
MSEGGTRPTAAKAYQSPADSGLKAGSTYTPPGVPAAREPEATLAVRRNSPESAADSHRTDPTPRVGDTVVHRVSGQRGTVTGHAAHGYGRAVPEVQWAGEEASWPQGVSANAVRVEGSNPSDLYLGNQDATSSRPLNRNTGAT